MRRRIYPIAVSTIFACAIAMPLLRGAGIPYLLSHATAVVAGSILTRTEGPSQVSFTISIEKVLTGTVPELNLDVVHSWTGVARNTHQTDQVLSGVWFLTKNPSGGPWDVLTARPLGVHTIFGLFLPWDRRSTYPTGTGVEDALAYQVAGGVEAANEDPEVLLGAIESMDSPAVRAILAGYLTSSKPGYQVVGLAGGLARGIPGTVEQLISLWPSVRDNSVTREINSALRSSWRDATPATVQQLVAFAQTIPAADKLREAIVWALAAIHSKETLPFLASLLSGADAHEKERGVYGLAAFANGCPMQTRDNVVSMAYLQCDQTSPYKTAETAQNFVFRPGTPDQQATAVTFWQGWWDSHPELH